MSLQPQHPHIAGTPYSFLNAYPGPNSLSPRHTSYFPGVLVSTTGIIFLSSSSRVEILESPFITPSYQYQRFLLSSDHCFPSDLSNSRLYAYDFHPKLSEQPNCSSFQLYPACCIQINLPKAYHDISQRSPKSRTQCHHDYVLPLHPHLLLCPSRLVLL